MRVLRVALQLSFAAIAAVCTRPPRESGSGSDTRQQGVRRLASMPATRRIATGFLLDFEGRPSPDGRYISMTDWETGDLALRDLRAARTIRLTNKGSWDQSQSFAEGSAISPDGRLIVYGWFDEKKLRYELRAMPLAGPDSGAARVILDAPDFEYAAPQAFTPDGKYVLVSMARSGGTRQILLVPVASCRTCTPRALKSFDWRTPFDLAISPDGQWVAYDFPPSQDREERDVYVLAMDGSRETAIAPHAAHDVVVGWTTDGSHLLFGSERAGTMGVYAIAMSNGKPAGDPVLVRSDVWGLSPLGGTRDGGIVYGVEVGSREVYAAIVDSKTGAAVSKPTSATASLRTRIGWNFAFSLDGQYLALLGYRGGATTGSVRDVIVRSIERGDTRRFTPSLASIVGVTWFPDGRSVLLSGRDDKGRVGFFRMSLESGTVTPLLIESRKGYPRSASISPDGQRVYFLDIADNGDMIVNELDVVNGGIRVLYRSAERSGALALTPDGKQLAFTASQGMARRIRIVSTDGGPAREVYQVPAGMTLAPYVLSWSPDARELFVGTIKGRGELPTDTVELRRLVIATGELRSVGVSEPGLRIARMTSDGKRIAYSVGDPMSELWVMEPPKFNAAASGKVDQK